MAIVKVARADIEGKKALMKIWIKQVVIGRDKDIARVEVWGVPPLLTPEGAPSGQKEVLTKL